MRRSPTLSPTKAIPTSLSTKLARTGAARHSGRSNRRRIACRTLLVRGLEYDHVVIAQGADIANQHNLYVALSRARKSVAVLGLTDQVTARGLSGVGGSGWLDGEGCVSTRGSDPATESLGDGGDLTSTVESCRLSHARGRFRPRRINSWIRWTCGLRFLGNRGSLEVRCLG